MTPLEHLPNGTHSRKPGLGVQMTSQPGVLCLSVCLSVWLAGFVFLIRREATELKPGESNSEDHIAGLPLWSQWQSEQECHHWAGKWGASPQTQTGRTYLLVSSSGCISSLHNSVPSLVFCAQVVLCIGFWPPAGREAALANTPGRSAAITCFWTLGPGPALCLRLRSRPLDGTLSQAPWWTGAVCCSI